MTNEWLELAWINFVKAILHGQVVVDNREIEIEQVLTEEQREAVYRLTEKHEREMARLLRSTFLGFVKSPESSLTKKRFVAS